MDLNVIMQWFLYVVPISKISDPENKILSLLNLGSFYKKKVKVREGFEEADQYDYERSSLQSLKAFEWLSLDHYSYDKSQGSVHVRIPGSSFPKSPTPGFQASEEEINKNKRALKGGGSNKHVRATSAPRLCSRAVLSSPDRERLIGSKTQTRRELLSPLKSHNSCLNRHTRCKIRSGDAEITAQQGHNKHPTESKKNIRAKGRPTPADKRHKKKDSEARCS
ncbi:hypothetical protein C2S52_006400 [Perilla frutescens var. hirtella]|nr:hypothetical protein C2S51_009404 [Perilla frutescens var. frutescens]KAH6786848.1 hypothetical protein C2S52_006400 [Perilla frutescens var. hirtella]